jgi:hypothetical protein
MFQLVKAILKLDHSLFSCSKQHIEKERHMWNPNIAGSNQRTISDGGLSSYEDKNI